MYSDYFSFDFHPFSPSVDKRIFYPSTAVTQSMAVLQHGLLDGDRMIVLSGANGTGKTCLVNKLVTELSESVRSQLLLADTFTEVELLQSIAFAFDVDGAIENRIVLFNEITRELRNISSRGKKILLIIDNAHHLDGACLRTIERLVDSQSTGEFSLSILLSGRSELVKNLVRQFGSVRDQRFRMISMLGALSLADTQGYINYRLQKSGVEDQDIISKAIVKEIYTLTAGIPRRINALCDISLLSAFAGQAQAVNGNHLEQALRKLGWSVKRRTAASDKEGDQGTNNNSTSKVSVKDVTGNSVSYRLNGEPMSIGRAPDCDIRIDEVSISRYQAEIVPSESGYLIKNKGSTTPILLNANTVISAPLQNGDVVSIGNYVLHFELPITSDSANNSKEAT